jgi:hypothetical protein
VSPLRSEWSRSLGARPQTSRLPRGRVLRNPPVCNGCNCSRTVVVVISSHPIAGWPHAHAAPATHKLPDSGRMARLQAPVVLRAVGPIPSRYLRSPKGEIAVTTPMVAGVIREYGDRLSALGQRYSWLCAQWLAIALSDGRRAGGASGCGAPALGGSRICVWRCAVWEATAARLAFSWFTDWGLRRGAPCNRPPLAARRSLKPLRWGSAASPTESSPSTALAAC